MDDQVKREFIESAKRFRQAKHEEVEHGLMELRSLDELIARYEGYTDLLPPESVVVGASGEKSPQVQTNTTNTNGEPPGDAPHTTADWIRCAMQKLDEFTNPQLISEIEWSNPSLRGRIAGARLSTELYGYAKRGEIEPIRQIPGGPKVYRKTDKFRTLKQVRSRFSDLHGVDRVSRKE